MPRTVLLPGAEFIALAVANAMVRLIWWSSIRDKASWENLHREQFNLSVRTMETPNPGSTIGHDRRGRRTAAPPMPTRSDPAEGRILGTLPH